MASTTTPAGGLAASEASGRGVAIRRLVVLLFLLGAARVLFPGDASFVNDEPLLIERALDANAAGTVATSGLLGTRGTRYGPAPTWFYQGALSRTSDLRGVVVARVVTVTVLTALALILLAGALGRLVPPLAAFAFVSPYLWLYARDLWDNSFAIPLVSMCLALYAHYLRRHSLSALALAALFGALAFLTHLMTLPVVIAVAVHFAATRWRRLVASPRVGLTVLATGMACLLLALPYLREVVGGSAAAFRLAPSPRSIVFALDGLRFFSLRGVDYFFGPWPLGGVGTVAVLLSLFSYPVGAYGALLWFRAAGGRAGGREGGSELSEATGSEGGEDGAPDAVERDFGRLLLGALALFVLMANGFGLRGHPHYFNGIWIVFFCFWWRGMSALTGRRWPRRAFLAQAAVMMLFLAGLAGWLHVNRGSKGLHIGPTLANQMAIAHELDRRGLDIAQPSPVMPVRLFPHALATLRRLDRRAGGLPRPANPASRRAIEVVYVDPDGPSGEITLGAVQPAQAGSR